MILKDLREALAQNACTDQAVILDNPSFDKSIIGVSDGRLVYCYESMIQELVQDDGCEYVDAIDFIDYNTIRAIPYMGEFAPIIMYKDIFDDL